MGEARRFAGQMFGRKEGQKRGLGIPETHRESY
jgi:hypothetical protein